MADTDQVFSSPVPYFLMTFIFFVCGLFVVSTLFVTIPLHPVFMKEFGINAGTAAWTTSISSFCYALGTVCFAPLSDRLGRRNTIVSGLLILMLVTPLIGVMPNSGSTIVMRGIQGFIAASFAPTALTYISECYPEHKRGTALGFISAGFLMAGIVGQIYSSVLIEFLHWSFVFYLFGAFYFILCVLFFFVIPGDRVHAASSRSVIQKFTDVLTKPIFLYGYVVTILILFSFTGMYSTLEAYLQDTYNYDDSRILWIRAAGIIGMLTAPFGGRLVSRFGIFLMMRIGLALAAAGLFFVGFSSSVGLLVIWSIFFTTGISITVPSVISFLGSYGGDQKANAMSLYSFFLFIGSTFGPVTAVYLSETGGYSFTFAVLAVMVICGFIVTFLLSKKTVV